MGQSEQLFILGAPRSGTTFLASLIGLTKYGKPFETHFFTKYYKLLSSYGDLENKENFSCLLKDILKERPVMQWRLDLNMDDFFQSLDGDHSYVNILNSLCLLRNSKLGFNFWGDKTPHYIGDFDIIQKLFPDAKFIYIVRDGRDVALSLLQKNWGPNNISSCAEYWKTLNKENVHFNRLKKNGQLLTLRYEDLLDNAESNVRDIYKFLDTDISESDVRSLCFTVKPDNYFKWKEKLSRSQIKVFDLIAANTLSRFGYETFGPENGVGILPGAFYKAHNKFLVYKFLFEINVIDGFKIKFLGKEPFAE